MISRFFILMALFLTTSLSAQKIEPVSWSFEVAQQDGAHVIKATAEIADKWVVYSPFTEKGGPIPTSIDLKDVELIGSIVEEGKVINEKSELFEINVSKFKKKVTFIQAFNPGPNQKEITGYVRFMTCDGERCLPPKNIDFSLAL